MRSLLKIALLLTVAFAFYACPSDDGGTSIVVRDEEEVYNENIAQIEEFLHTHYVTIDADYNTVFAEIPEGGSQTPIWDMPELVKNFEVELNDISYKMYYLKMNEGQNLNPTPLDSVYASYKGIVFEKVTEVVGSVSTTYTKQTVFDQALTPTWFKLEDVISGWSEIFPLFKTGDFSENPLNGDVSYSNFGAGVMFVPSGLAYFNEEKGLIPAYSPLIFTFGLKGLRYRDHDGDKVLTKDEYREPEVGDIVDYVNGKVDFKKTAKDTDGDGQPDYLDIDDDGDGYLTKTEVRFTYVDGGQTITSYYPFQGATTDDPSTPYDDRRGIPRKFTGPIVSPSTLPSPIEADFTDVARLRRHLDKTCKPPYQN